MVRVTKDLEEKIGEERLEELVEKDWKVSELPTEEELSEEKSESPKARSNPNSRKNLIQYRQRTKEQKEAALKNLKINEVEEDVDPKTIFGDIDIGFLEQIMPAKKILKNRDEQLIYYHTIHQFLKDFSLDELSFGDIDDIVTLAINRILEQRLLAVATKSEKLVLEAAPSIEKFRKHSDKIKSNLASRRVDRIDLKNKPALSIVELAAHLDAQEQLDFERRVQELANEDQKYKPPARTEEGVLIDE